MNQLWRNTLCALARSARLKQLAQSRQLGMALARQYTGGSDATAAAALAQRLQQESAIGSSLYFLGEYVASLEDVERNVQAKLAAVSALAARGLELHVSVDPTQVGLMQDRELMRSNLERIASALAAAAQGRPGWHALMLDMEDASVTQTTLDAHAALRAQGLPAAVTVQAYRHRTGADLSALVQAGAMVRLVKGAFPAGPELALQRRDEVHAAYLQHLTTLLSPQALALGVRPVIATHDHRLHAAAIELAQGNGWAPQQYEFEMLLGARNDVARRLAAAGHRVRLYLPFGSDWWPYAMRRIGENPASALILLRGALGRG